MDNPLFILHKTAYENPFEMSMKKKILTCQITFT